MYFKVDQRFLDYFRNLKQVFLYITDECDLRCIHCLYKPDLTFHLKEKEIGVTTALALISDFREMGASKLTIMSGEPTLYGVSHERVPLLKVIEEARDLGYEYIRIDTNGQFEERLLEKADFKKIDEITFSLDGPIPEINDAIRGEGYCDDAKEVILTEFFPRRNLSFKDYNEDNITWITYEIVINISIIPPIITRYLNS